MPAEALQHSGYQIRLYESDDITGAVNLLTGSLWSTDRQLNADYFRWKYHDNPYARRPLGAVALQGNDVVAFRGYFATEWRIGNNGDKTAILVPGDAITHPDHRSKGLSLAMGELAMESFAGDYSHILNTTAVQGLIAGYLRNGFVPLGYMSFYRKSNLGRDVKVLAKGALCRGKGKNGAVTRASPLEEGPISLGRFGDIQVSGDPRPADMVKLVSADRCARSRIKVLQDETFFRWRFDNPKGSYVFYYSGPEKAPLGYLVLTLSSDARQGFVVDYAEKEPGQIAKIFDHILDRREVDELNVLNLSVDSRLWDILNARRFKNRGLHRMVKKWVYGERPVLVRPIRAGFSESDWFLGGMDVRDPKNWQLKPSCQDSV